MSSKSRWLILLVSTPLVLLVAVGGLIGAPSAAPQQTFSHLKVFRDVVSLVEEMYVEEADMNRVMEGAMRGLADALDRSSAFLTPDEVKEIESKQPVPAGDVGLVVTRQFSWLRVIGVRDGSPAGRAGIQTGDYIRMIDKRATREVSGYTGMRLLRGAPGSKVSVTVIRANPADPHVFNLVREAPSGEFVVTKSVGGVSHVRISRFAPQIRERLQTVFGDLQKQKAAGAVIDLRGTADGSLEDGIAAAKLFVKNGGTVAVRAARGKEPVVVKSGAEDGQITLPIVLLVSNGTANAAEVFAAALAGNDRAEVVGELTAGLAGYQKLVKLPENHGLWITYERHLLVDSSGPLHERGLRPTVGVEIPAIGFDELPPATDEPLTKAIERLKTKRAA